MRILEKTTFYFWSELLKPRFVELSLKNLADHGFGIILAVRPNILDKILSIVKLCNDYSIDLNFWPLLSYNQGYWVNAWNLALQKQWIHKLMTQYPSVKTYAIDLESPLNFKGISGIIKTKKLAQIRPWQRVRSDMELMIDQMHNLNVKVISTNYPTNPSGRLKKGTPRPRNADFYSYMVYTSLFAIFGNDVSKDNVVAYAGKKILDAHGIEKSIIDLGLTSSGVLPKFLPVTTLERIISEVAICKYLCFKRIHIFALDEIRRNVNDWMEAIKLVHPKKPPFEIDPSNLGVLFRIFRTFLLKETLKLEP